jgi:endonuclease/exonuclease/phosphatase (EEP) superfamily protein YafD
MDRPLTLPLIKMIFKPICIVILLLVTTIGICRGGAYFLAPPAQLTVLTKDDLYYKTLCPTLSELSITTEQKQVHPPFKLLNWNIYKQQKENWGSSLREWAQHADFITLQEAKLSPELIKFSHQEEFFYLQNYAFKYNSFVYGVNTLSQVAPISVCGSTYKEPWIWVPKTGIASTYPIIGSTDLLLLINLHGVNFTITEQPLKAQFLPYFTLIAQHAGPIIFSGDFNTWSDIRLATIKQSLIQLGFSEVLFDDDKRLTIFDLAVDHIYFRGLKVIEAKSLATDASDHSPQLVTFDLARPVTRFSALKESELNQ